jgi:hypothetical protein
MKRIKVHSRGIEIIIFIAHICAIENLPLSSKFCSKIILTSSDEKFVDEIPDEVLSLIDEQN